MNPFDPLRYRGVFDYPTVRTHNLLPPGNDEETAYEDTRVGRTRIEKWEKSHTVKHEDPANPVFTSEHVIRFFGWAGRHAKYVGNPNPGTVLDQRQAWIEIWLQKGRHEAEREQQRKAAKIASVSTQKSAQRRARAA